MPDTLWHLAGWAIALLGAPLLARALLADRAKGRRRCPKCWYAMDGVPATSPDAAHPSANPTYLCPECGHTARSEKALLKTRRRLNLLPLTPVAIFLGYLVWTIPRLQREGAVGLIPTTYLILAVPYPEPDYFAPQSQHEIKLRETLGARVYDTSRQRPPQLYWWHLPLWELSLNARYASAHSPAVDQGCRSIIDTLDATLVEVPHRGTISELAGKLSRATGVQVRFDGFGDDIVHLEETSDLSASRALDLICEDLHGRVVWTVSPSGIDLIAPDQIGPPAFCSYEVGAIIDRRYIFTPKDYVPPTPMRFGPDGWVDHSDDLMDAITSLIYTDGWTWNGGDASRGEVAGSRLFVAAQPKEQIRVAQLVNALNAALAQGKPGDAFPTGLLGAAVTTDAPAQTIVVYVTWTWENSHVVDALQSSISPDSWTANGGNAASVHSVNRLLVISAPAELHVQIAAKIDEIENGTATP